MDESYETESRKDRSTCSVAMTASDHMNENQLIFSSTCGMSDRHLYAFEQIFYCNAHRKVAWNVSRLSPGEGWGRETTDISG